MTQYNTLNVKFTDLQLKDTLKAFNDFKNSKKLYELILLYGKVCIFRKCIQDTIYTLR